MRAYATRSALVEISPTIARRAFGIHKRHVMQSLYVSRTGVPRSSGQTGEPFITVSGMTFRPRCSADGSLRLRASARRLSSSRLRSALPRKTTWHFSCGGSPSVSANQAQGIPGIHGGVPVCRSQEKTRSMLSRPANRTRVGLNSAIRQLRVYAQKWTFSSELTIRFQLSIYSNPSKSPISWILNHRTSADRMAPIINREKSDRLVISSFSCALSKKLLRPSLSFQA